MKHISSREEIRLPIGLPHFHWRRFCNDARRVSGGQRAFKQVLGMGRSVYELIEVESFKTSLLLLSILGEDDELYERAIFRNLSFFRYPASVARYGLSVKFKAILIAI